MNPGDRTCHRHQRCDGGAGGRAWRSLDQGEAVRFAADRPHGYRNLGVAPAIFHNLIHYPSMATR